MIEQTIIYCYANFRNQITNLCNFSTFVDGDAKSISDKKVFDKCVDYIFTNDQSLKPPNTLCNMKHVKNTLDLRIEKHNYFNVTLSTKYTHTLFKLKIIGLRSNDIPLYYIGTSDENFGHVIDVIKKNKMDCNGIFTYIGKELSRNDLLTSYNFQNGDNVIMYQKKVMNKINIINVNVNVADNNMMGDGPEPKKVDKCNKDNKSNKVKKQPIKQAKKISVWHTHVGKTVGSRTCFCCKTSEITQLNFACGHVVSEHDGGTLDVNNLRPVCTACNSSMGTKNMRDFMRDNMMGDLE